MNNIFGKNIIRLRKEHGLTQDELAKSVNVSFQAVSKWENGNSLPDITVLPLLANSLHCSIDSLMGYAAEQRLITNYEKRYKAEGYYWGIQPSEMCFEVMKLCPPIKPLKLLDVACGEGKNAVFFAKNGYSVSAFDVAISGIDKAKALAETMKTKVNFFRADLLDFRLDTDFDIIFCTGALHYIPQKYRKEILENYFEHTCVGGIHALNVFVKKPFVKVPPNEDCFVNYWSSGELFTYYADWSIEDCSEVIFYCMSGGVPHKHCMDTLYARKVL